MGPTKASDPGQELLGSPPATNGLYTNGDLLTAPYAGSSIRLAPVEPAPADNSLQQLGLINQINQAIPNWNGPQQPIPQHQPVPVATSATPSQAFSQAAKPVGTFNVNPAAQTATSPPCPLANYEAGAQTIGALLAGLYADLQALEKCLSQQKSPAGQQPPSQTPSSTEQKAAAVFTAAHNATMPGNQASSTPSLPPAQSAVSNKPGNAILQSSSVGVSAFRRNSLSPSVSPSVPAQPTSMPSEAGSGTAAFHRPSTTGPSNPALGTGSSAPSAETPSPVAASTAGTATFVRVQHMPAATRGTDAARLPENGTTQGLSSLPGQPYEHINTATDERSERATKPAPQVNKPTQVAKPVVVRVPPPVVIIHH